MKRFLNLAFYPLLAILVFNFFFKGTAEANGSQAYEQLLAGKAVFLDIREKDEVASGMIKGAQWLPLSTLKGDPTTTMRKLKDLMKEKELYVYCRSGRRADSFLTEVKSHGIKGLNLGGYEDLVTQGLPSQKP
jgi:rhodanese-related sulfurtransferase